MTVHQLLKFSRKSHIPLYSVIATILYSNVLAGSQAAAIAMKASKDELMSLILSAGGVSSKLRRRMRRLHEQIEMTGTNASCSL